MSDLFLSKSDILMERLKHLQIFSSVTIEEMAREIGESLVGDNYMSSTARRQVRLWAEKGIFKKLDDKEILHRGLYKKGRKQIAWYEFVK